MRWALFFLCLVAAAGCVVEDRPVVPDLDGSVEAGECGFCPTDEPVCADGACVECTAQERGLCEERDQRCDDDAMLCVDCLSNDDCTLPAASRCDLELNECAACITDPDCDGVDGLGAMDNACDRGVCVECTPETEATTCEGGVSCNPSTKTCTNTVVGSLGVCEPCVSDSECGTDGTPSDAHRCVPMFYPNDQTQFPDDDTGFCLKTTEGGCEQPFSITLFDRTSLSDAPPDDYCGINEDLATCPAVDALVRNVRCDEGTDDQCPESGICRQVGNLLNRCTYRCSSLIECLENEPDGRPGATCGASGTGSDDYCGG